VANPASIVHKILQDPECNHAFQSKLLLFADEFHFSLSSNLRLGNVEPGVIVMPIRIEMPRLSDTMEEGTLLKWRVKVGDKVAANDVVADIETDKATMELQVFDAGTVASLVAPEGSTMKIGSEILLLAKAGESVEDVAKSAGQAKGSSAAAPEKKATKAAGCTDRPGGDQPPEADAATAVMDPPASSGKEQTAGDQRLRVSPLAKKMAADSNVELSELKGTGPDGRIIKRDIEAAVASGSAKKSGAAEGKSTSAKSTGPAVAPVAALESKLVPITNMRKTIAKRLVESKQTIPHFTVTMSVDLQPLTALRGTINKQLEAQGVKLSVNDFIVRATAVALTQHPVVNSSWTSEGIQYHGEVNIGVAVALPEEKGGGLVVPTLRNADAISLRTISIDTKKLAKKARETGLSVSEMSDGTFTISNLGMFGVEHFEAIINPPQAAILAIGAGIEKPVVRDGKIVIGQEMSLTLSADHRVIDGATAAQFLVALKGLIESPASMLV